ncbi:MAG: LolA family protein [Bacteroidota bacterium]
MKHYLLATSLLLSGLIGLAQGNSTTNDPAATKVLNGVSAKFKTYNSVQANFSYKVENASGKALSTKTGTILMKGTSYKLSFSGLEVYCNGKTVWSYDKAAKEVTINNLDASGGTITPQKLFTNFYDKDFYSLLKPDTKVGSKTLQEIQMTPVDKSKNFHSVVLLIDKSAQSIYSTKVMEKSGNRYSYTVSSMKTDVAVTDAMFTFDPKKYPGVMVEDLR